MFRYIALVGVIVSCALSAGCAASLQEMGRDKPEIFKAPHTYREMMALPAPKGRIPVTVYKFTDQTGQYKPLPGVSSFSTAVTQGATSMLLESLKNSGWFMVLEREGLQNLLTERKIVRAALKQKNGNGAEKQLPTLDFARILLQGGITAYETNTLTGGVGAEYWGLGGSTEYRKDRVTVHLRAVDIHTGQVLLSISTSKTILSYKIQASFFRYLTFKRLLSIEAGYSVNEPVQMCVATAIDKAVICLLVKGIKDGLWKLKDVKEIKNKVIQDYLEELNLVPYEEPPVEEASTEPKPVEVAGYEH